MFSAVKFVVAGVIVALFGGFLLIGIPTTPTGHQIAPGAVTDSLEPTDADAKAFPTGTFVSVENDHLMLEFGGDGTAVKHDLAGNTISFTYAVDGDVYTWLTSEHGRGDIYGQAQYAWDYDGARLAFELLGEDRFGYRKWVYAENTYELVEDPQAAVVAAGDIDAGDPVRAKEGFVPAAEVGPDAYASILDAIGKVAVVSVSKGQVLTPEALGLEPAEVTTAPTESGKPVARSDILPGVALTVEEVEQGVFRVVNDGVEDLAPDAATSPVVGKDGRLWLLAEQGFSRLGTDVTYGWPNDQRAHGFDVAPDGTVWTTDVTVRKSDRRVLRIRSFDGETWTVQRKALDTETNDPYHPGRALTIASDGVVWASWADPDTDTTKYPRAAVVARFGADGWESLAQTIEGTSGSVPLFVTDEDEVWADPVSGPILRYADGGWEPMTPEGVGSGTGGRGDVGPDGTLWLVSHARGAESVDGCPKDAACVVRYDGSDWHGWAGPDGLLDVDWAYAYPVNAAPDGSLWVIADVSSDSKDGGIARFDGSQWRNFMTGRFVWALDIAADGTVWFIASNQDYYDTDGVARDDLEYGLYVITPEAMTATAL